MPVPSCRALLRATASLLVLAVPAGAGLLPEPRPAPVAVAAAAAPTSAVPVGQVTDVAPHRPALPASPGAVLEPPVAELVVDAPPPVEPVAVASEAPVVQERAAAPRAVRAAVAPRSDEDIEARGQRALASITWPWRELGWDVVFAPYSGGRLGFADARAERITVYVRATQSDLSLRVTIAHELGHALDAVTGTDELRRGYLRERGVDEGTAWFPCEGCDDLSSPAGDFAEVFALHVVGRGDFRSRLAGEPDDAQLQRLAPSFRPPSQRRAAAPPPPAEREEEDDRELIPWY